MTYTIGKPETAVALTETAEDRISESHEKVQNWLNNGRVIYGITTGAGKLLHTIIPRTSLGR